MAIVKKGLVRLEWMLSMILCTKSMGWTRNGAIRYAFFVFLLVFQSIPEYIVALTKDPNSYSSMVGLEHGFIPP